MIQELLALITSLFRPVENSTVSVVDFETFARLEGEAEANQRQVAKREGEPKGGTATATADPLQPAVDDVAKAKEVLRGRNAIWRRFDDAIREVMRRHHRRVGSHGRLDFYHSEDWFHELCDGFAVMTARALTFPLLRDVQAVTARHHPAALVSFGGEMDTPVLGLHVLVTATGIFAAWKGLSAADCRTKLRQTKVRIL